MPKEEKWQLDTVNNLLLKAHILERPGEPRQLIPAGEEYFYQAKDISFLTPAGKKEYATLHKFLLEDGDMVNIVVEKNALKTTNIFYVTKKNSGRIEQLHQRGAAEGVNPSLMGSQVMKELGTYPREVIARKQQAHVKGHKTDHKLFLSELIAKQTQDLDRIDQARYERQSPQSILNQVIHYKNSLLRVKACLQGQFEDDPDYQEIKEGLKKLKRYCPDIEKLLLRNCDASLRQVNKVLPVIAKYVPNDVNETKTESTTPSTHHHREIETEVEVFIRHAYEDMITNAKELTEILTLNTTDSLFRGVYYESLCKAEVTIRKHEFVCQDPFLKEKALDAGPAHQNVIYDMKYHLGLDNTSSEHFLSAIQDILDERKKTQKEMSEHTAQGNAEKAKRDQAKVRKQKAEAQAFKEKTLEKEKPQPKPKRKLTRFGRRDGYNYWDTSVSESVELENRESASSDVLDLLSENEPLIPADALKSEASLEVQPIPSFWARCLHACFGKRDPNQVQEVRSPSSWRYFFRYLFFDASEISLLGFISLLLGNILLGPFNLLEKAIFGEHANHFQDLMDGLDKCFAKIERYCCKQDNSVKPLYRKMLECVGANKTRITSVLGVALHRILREVVNFIPALIEILYSRTKEFVSEITEDFTETGYPCWKPILNFLDHYFWSPLGNITWRPLFRCLSSSFSFLWEGLNQGMNCLTKVLNNFICVPLKSCLYGQTLLTDESESLDAPYEIKDLLERAEEFNPQIGSKIFNTDILMTPFANPVLPSKPRERNDILSAAVSGIESVGDMMCDKILVVHPVKGLLSTATYLAAGVAILDPEKFISIANTLGIPTEAAEAMMHGITKIGETFASGTIGTTISAASTTAQLVFLGLDLPAGTESLTARGLTYVAREPAKVMIGVGACYMAGYLLALQVPALREEAGKMPEATYFFLGVKLFMSTVELTTSHEARKSILAKSLGEVIGFVFILLRFAVSIFSGSFFYTGKLLFQNVRDFLGVLVFNLNKIVTMLERWLRIILRVPLDAMTIIFTCFARPLFILVNLIRYGTINAPMPFDGIIKSKFWLYRKGDALVRLLHSTNFFLYALASLVLTAFLISTSALWLSVSACVGVIIGVVVSKTLSFLERQLVRRRDEREEFDDHVSTMTYSTPKLLNILREVPEKEKVNGIRFERSLAKTHEQLTRTLHEKNLRLNQGKLGTCCRHMFFEGAYLKTHEREAKKKLSKLGKGVEMEQVVISEMLNKNFRR